jgi:hypothetical protein
MAGTGGNGSYCQFVFQLTMSLLVGEEIPIRKSTPVMATNSGKKDCLRGTAEWVNYNDAVQVLVRLQVLGEEVPA